MDDDNIINHPNSIFICSYGIWSLFMNTKAELMWSYSNTGNIITIETYEQMEDRCILRLLPKFHESKFVNPLDETDSPVVNDIFYHDLP